MQRLIKFPLKDTPDVERLRRTAKASPCDGDAQIALALSLCGAGCTYEAASILRPLRSHWKSTADGQLANRAIESQAWWNKNWREFVLLKNSGQQQDALALLGDRSPHYWDLPHLLVHLGDIAAENDQLALASHVYRRVTYLSERGLPKLDMASFAYVSQAALIDVLCKSGDASAALKRHRALTPNFGNAMAHEIQHVKLLVAAGNLDEAMLQAAALLVTANNNRTGYSKDIRLAFIKSSPDLQPLRGRADWTIMQRDPDAFLRTSKKPKRNL